MSATKPLALLLAAMLAACNQAAQPVTEPSASAVAEAVEAPTTAVSTAPASPDPPPAAPDLPASFTALGTEPFWAAKVDGATLLYQTPEDQAGTRVAVARRGVGERVELSGTLAGAPLVLTVSVGKCSDGMSDTVYPYTAELRLGGEALKGCAKPA